MLPLKEATSEKHRQAERMAFNVRMFKGLLKREEYLLYLNQQLHVFQVIERIGLPHNSLERSTGIRADIEELNAQGYISGQIRDSTKNYADYIDSMTYEQVLLHIYLNYLAVMFGGQMMKKSVTSNGRMYEFENMQEALQSVRNVQKDEWADEVNKGFDFMILIFEELETKCLN